MEDKKTNERSTREGQDDVLREALRFPLPKEALKPHPTKSYLTTINPMYIIERLNDVFGVGKWFVRYEIVEKVSIVNKTWVIAKAHLTVPIGRENVTISAYGGNDNDDLGDAYKGACTDAFTKCCQMLEIGSEVWKDTSKHAIVKSPIMRQSAGPTGSAKPKNPQKISEVLKGGPSDAELSGMAKRIFPHIPMPSPSDESMARSEYCRVIKENWRDIEIHFGVRKGIKIGDLYKESRSIFWGWAKHWEPKQWQGNWSLKDLELRWAFDCAIAEMAEKEKKEKEGKTGKDPNEVLTEASGKSDNVPF